MSYNNNNNNNNESVENTQGFSGTQLVTRLRQGQFFFTWAGKL